MQQTGTLLIIDDEPDVCILLRRMLRHQFARIEYAHTLSDANLWASLIAPEVILLDNNLPDGHGLDYIAAFKSLLPASRIVMISAMDIHQEALAAGADYFLSKPIDAQQLNLLR